VGVYLTIKITEALGVQKTIHFNIEIALR